MFIKLVYILQETYAKSGEIYIHHENSPICSNDGFYGKLQYDTKNINRKYCSDRDGEMIESFEGSTNTLSGQKMNCECALARKYLTSSKPKCCQNGNYKSTQCNGGLCYCVDEYGRQLGGEVDQANQRQLECYAEVEKFDYCCEQYTYTKGDWCYVDK